MQGRALRKGREGRCRVYSLDSELATLLESYTCADDEIVLPCPSNLFTVAGVDPSACILVSPFDRRPTLYPYQELVVLEPIDRGRQGRWFFAGKELLEELDWLSESVRLICSEDSRSRIFIDVGMSRAELLSFYKRYGVFPVQLMERKGLLTRCTVLVNAFWLASWERNAVARHSSKIVLSMTDALRAGSVPLLTELREHGIAYGFATGYHGGTAVSEAQLAYAYTAYTLGTSRWDVALNPLVHGSPEVLGIKPKALLVIRAKEVYDLVSKGFAVYHAIVAGGRVYKITCDLA
jgi:hypothetical protein